MRKINLPTFFTLLTVALLLTANLFAQQVIPDNMFTLSNHNGYNISCAGGSNGSISTANVLNFINSQGGTGSYSWSWSNGDTIQNLTSIPAAAYILVVTDLNTNNFWIGSLNLSQPAALNVGIDHTDVYPYMGNNGTAQTGVAGGVQNYAYHWSDGEIVPRISHLAAGTYSVTVTDANSCTAAASVTITQPSQVTVSVSNIVNISCYGGSNGAFTVSATGGQPGYTYYYVSPDGQQHGLHTNTVSNLPAAPYIVHAVDANGADVSTTITLTQPSALNITLGTTAAVSCYGCSDGTMGSTVTGGVTSYSYQWSDADGAIVGTAATLASVGAGTYLLLVTDHNGCTATASRTLTQPAKDNWQLDGNTGTNPYTQFIGTRDSTDLVVRTNNVERMRVGGNGNVDLKDTLRLSAFATDSMSKILFTAPGSGGRVLGIGVGNPNQPCVDVPSPHWISVSNVPCGFSIQSNNISDDTYYWPTTGNVGIGINPNNGGNGIPTGYKLAIAGNIICENLHVQLTPWDVVFDKKYKFLSIYELEKFIDKEHHLPNFKSAKEIEADNGASVGEMQSSLLRTTEELTLYSIQQQHRLDKQQQEIDELKKEINELKNK